MLNEIIVAITILLVGFMIGWTASNSRFKAYADKKLAEYQDKIVNNVLRLDDPVSDYINRCVQEAFDQGFDEGTGIGMDVGMRMCK